MWGKTTKLLITVDVQKNRVGHVPCRIPSSASVVPCVTSFDGIDRQLTDPFRRPPRGYSVDWVDFTTVKHPGDVQRKIPFRDGAKHRGEVIGVDGVLIEFEW